MDQRPPTGGTARSLSRAWSTLLTTAVLAAGAVLPATPAQAEGGAALTVTAERTIAPLRVKAPGDLARSTYPRKALFTVDRSSKEPRVVAVADNGRVLGTVRLRRASVRTPWVVAAGKGHQMWVGDIADFGHSRPMLQVYRFDEPRRLGGRRTVAAPRFNLRYPDGRHHASTLLVNPATGRVFVVTREAAGAGIYRLPAPLSARRVNVMQRVGSAPADVVSGSFSAGGARLVLATRTQLFSYRTLGGVPVVSDLPAGVSVDNAELARGGSSVLVNGPAEPHLVNAITAAEPPPVDPPPATTDWVPDLTDEFDSFDTSIWKARDHQAYTRDAAVVLARNVTVQDSALRVQAKLETVDGRDYTSGDLDTYGKYSMPNYFRVEVRAKVPYEQGMWAAPIWIRPADGSAGEIDLIETYGSERARPIIHQTIHTEYGTTHRQVHQQTPFATVGGSGLDWHTYVVEKTPGKIVMWVDGVKTSEFTSASPDWYDTYYEAGKRWSLRSSLQVGGGQGLPDGTTDWAPDKTAMIIDYVKTWVPAS